MTFFIQFALLMPLYGVAVTGCQFSEVALVLDVSGTIYPSAFNQTKNFINKILSNIKITPGSDSSRVSVVTFAETADVRITCDEYNSSASLENAIKKLTHGDEEFTNLRQGLLKGQETLSQRGCGRTQAKKIMILISDGRANRGLGGFQGIKDVARNIRDQGITMMAIGVGNRINTPILTDITGNASLVITSTELDDQLFDGAMHIMSAETCRPESEPRICDCKVPDSLVNITAIPLDEAGVATQYQGSCYLEKITNAYTELIKQFTDFTHQSTNNMGCSQELKQMIAGSQNVDSNTMDSMFLAYDVCIRAQCQMDRAQVVLNQRKSFLSKESGSCESYTNPNTVS